MSSTATSDPPRSGADVPNALRHALVVALGTGIVGAALLALLECAAAVATTAEDLRGLGWPWRLVLAGLGKAAVTHTIFWGVLMLVAVVPYWLVVRRRPMACPMAFFPALLILLATVIVAPADLEMSGHTGRGLLLAVVGGGVLFALAYWRVARRWLSRSSRRLRSLFVMALVVPCAALTVVSGVVFLRSPFFNPATYRVASGEPHGSTADRPHVLWIVLDTVLADHLSCYGYAKPTTPFLESWAKRSFVFEQAVSNGIWTLPAHASMFTGLSVRAHGADNPYPWKLEAPVPTVAEILTDHDYAGISFSNNPLIAPETNLTRGFSEAHVLYNLRHLNRFSLEYLCVKWGLPPPLPWLDPDYGAALTNTLLAEWLDGHAEDDRPTFVFLNYMDAHAPYRVPQTYRRRFLNPAQVQRSYALRRARYGDIVARTNQRYNIEGPDFLPPADRAVLRGQYDAAIRYLDDRVREVLEMYRQRGLLDDTLVVITSDHGEYLGTHDMWSHCFLTYQDLLHVALLIRFPGGGGSSRVTTPVQLADLFPTVLGTALGHAVDPPAPFGLDLRTVVENPPDSRIVVAEYNGPNPRWLPRMRRVDRPAVKHRMEPQVAALDGRFKYMASADGQRELYDLMVDPGELHNLIDTFPAEAERLAAYLDQWYDAVPAYTPPGADSTLSPATLKALRSLGYVGQ